MKYVKMFFNIVFMPIDGFCAIWLKIRGFYIESIDYKKIAGEVSGLISKYKETINTLNLNNKQLIEHINDIKKI